MRCLLRLGVVVLLLSPPLLSYAQAPAQVSMEELEDRDFVQNLFQDKKYQFALEEAQNYMRKNPKGFFVDEMRFVLAQVYSQQGEDKKAQAEYARIIQDYPESAYLEDAYYFLALLKIREGEIADGEAYLAQLKERFPFSKRL